MMRRTAHQEETGIFFCHSNVKCLSLLHISFVVVTSTFSRILVIIESNGLICHLSFSPLGVAIVTVIVAICIAVGGVISHIGLI